MKNKDTIPVVLPENSNFTNIMAQLVFLLTLVAGSLYQLSWNAKVFSLVMSLILASYSILFFRLSVRWLVMYAYLGLVLAWSILSAAGLMEGAWTTIRTNELLIRQTSVHFLFPLTAIGFAAIFSSIGKKIKNVAALYVIPTSLAALLIYSQTNQVGQSSDVFLINNLYSLEVFRIFFLGILVLSIKRNLYFFPFLLIILYFSFSVQAYLATLVILAARVIHAKTWMVFTGLLIIVFTTILSTIYWEFLLTVEHNFGFRALFWRNALLALYQTGFVGVGYGTESIIPFYPSGGVIRYFGPSDPSEYSLIGVHSSFYQQLFNTGILGLSLISTWIGLCIRRLGGQDGVIHPFDLLAVGLFFISIFSNMALDSYNFMLGSAFLLGWVIYRGNVRSAVPLSRHE